MMLRAISGENTTGTRCVGTLLAPSLRSARSAAILPISSGLSSFAVVRALEYQLLPCILPSASTAIGEAEKPQ